MAHLAIRTASVNKTYKHLKAVNALSFDVETGTCFGLLGPNGAGKTTMMSMIYGKARRDTENGGTISVLGYDPEASGLEIRFLSGIVPQENNLDAELSVAANLEIYSRFYGLSRSRTRTRIDSLLEFMELTEKRQARIRDLSGGMQRRLVIARALLNAPKLLILDEPTTGLDPQVRQLIWDKLRSLKNQGVTILLCTHYMEEAYQLCDHLIIMHRGRKILEGRPSDLIQQEMEAWVLEIFDASALDSASLPRSVQLEKTASRVMLYSDSLESLTGLSKTLTAGNFLLRQSNLEDLFLRATGRNLNE